MNERPRHVRRTVYPKPEHRFSNAKIGTTYRESTADFPPLDGAPPNAPNVVIVLLDDVGYAWPSVYGGLVRMPTAERLASQGLTYCQFHTTGLCAPTRAAFLTGRNHRSVSAGVVQEMATGFPGYCGILPRSCATIAQMLSPNGYAKGSAHPGRPCASPSRRRPAFLAIQVPEGIAAVSRLRCAATADRTDAPAGRAGASGLTGGLGGEEHE